MLKLSDELDLPISAVTQTFAFLGKRGGGKTYAAVNGTASSMRKEHGIT